MLDVGKTKKIAPLEVRGAALERPNPRRRLVAHLKAALIEAEVLGGELSPALNTLLVRARGPALEALPDITHLAEVA